MSRVPRAPPTVLMPFTGPEHLLSRGVGGNSSSSGLAAAGLSQEPGKGLREKLEPPLHWAGKTRGGPRLGKESGEENTEKPRHGERDREGHTDAKNQQREKRQESTEAQRQTRGEDRRV